MRALAIIALLASPARADDPPPRGDATSIEHRVNLRVGASTADTNRRPTICAEVAVAWGLSVEGCGTGSGFLHHDDGGQIAHFRAKKILATRGAAALAAGLGFAELEVGRDDPGFDFGTPDAREPTAVAGPDAALSARYLAPLGRGFELIANLALGLAYFHHAPALVVPQRRTQPYASFEIGVGW
ncbi:MAG TPA: hypothetical protein VML75_12770 [Kofleriaceae bacterium]|nr:hypothetical protein [Kofleriaceae bacterium]